MKIAIFFLATTMLAQTRIASDFEMRQMEQQVAHSSDFLSQLSGHLNLGDLRMTRNETALARAEYSKGLEIAMNERLAARRASAMTRYSTATSYAALAAAKLGDAASAFALSEEAIRYASDSAKSWNLYATAMSALHLPAKAASASRNAVMIAAHENDPLDLAIDQYTLASSLIELNQNDEAEMLLFDVVSSLRSDRFASLRRGVEKSESFEIYSSARGEQAAYISLLNRAQLRLARLHEDRGNFAKAREQYENVLAARTDDPTALAAMARLARTTEERERYYAQAFDANPFSPALIRDYQKSLSVAAGPSAGRVPAGEAPTQSTGEQVRLALQEALDEGCVHSPRADGVGADALSNEVHGDGTGQRDDSAFARAVGGPAVHRDQASDRGDVHEHPTLGDLGHAEEGAVVEAGAGHETDLFAAAALEAERVGEGEAGEGPGV